MLVSVTGGGGGGGGGGDQFGRPCHRLVVNCLVHISGVALQVSATDNP